MPLKHRFGWHFTLNYVFLEGLGKRSALGAGKLGNCIKGNFVVHHLGFCWLPFPKFEYLCAKYDWKN